MAAHREWLKIAEHEKTLERAKEEIYSAYVVALRYRLLRDALLAAGMKAEAEQAETKRRAVVEVWKAKLSGRNDAEVLLR